MIDDEIDRRAHFVITETPFLLYCTLDPPTERAMAMSIVVDLLLVAVASSALSPCSALLGEMADGRHGADTEQMPPGGPRAAPCRASV
jgi:hypothetical protein